MYHDRHSRFVALAELELNDEQVRLTGRGSVEPNDGIVEGTYQYEPLPGLVDPFIFKSVLITGYPSICQSRDGKINPFKAGSYRYRRTVDFGEHGALRYEADCKIDGSDSEARLVSTFVGEGDLSIPPIEIASPVVETWVPAGRQVRGTFLIGWRRKDGQGYVVGRAHTEYELPVEADPLACLVHRRISFPLASSNSTSLQVKQSSFIM